MNGFVFISITNSQLLKVKCFSLVTIHSNSLLLFRTSWEVPEHDLKELLVLLLLNSKSDMNHQELTQNQTGCSISVLDIMQYLIRPWNV